MGGADSNCCTFSPPQKKVRKSGKEDEATPSFSPFVPPPLLCALRWVSRTPLSFSKDPSSLSLVENCAPQRMFAPRGGRGCLFWLRCTAHTFRKTPASYYTRGERKKKGREEKSHYDRKRRDFWKEKVGNFFQLFFEFVAASQIAQKRKKKKRL